MKVVGYSVTSQYCEVSVLVFAVNVAQAKAQAKESDWLCDEEWNDLRAIREPGIDSHAGKYGIGHLDMSAPDMADLARNLGWYETTSGTEACVSCGLFPWSLLPDSALDESGECVSCRRANGAPS